MTQVNPPATQITPQLIRIIASQLLPGDKKKLQEITGYDYATVHRAFKADSVTVSARVIVEAAYKLIHDRRKKEEKIVKSFSK